MLGNTTNIFVDLLQYICWVDLSLNLELKQINYKFHISLNLEILQIFINLCYPHH